MEFKNFYLVYTSNDISLGATFIVNMASVRLLANSMNFLPPLSGILPLAKPSGLLITLQIEAILTSDRWARISVKSIPWSSTSFSTTVWLYISLISILYIFSLIFQGWHQWHDLLWLSTMVSATQPSVDCLLLILAFVVIMVLTFLIIRDIIQILVSITSTHQASKVSNSHSPHQSDGSTNKTIGACTAVSLAMTTTLMAFEWSLFKYFEWDGTMLCWWLHSPHCLTLEGS